MLFVRCSLSHHTDPSRLVSRRASHWKWLNEDLRGGILDVLLRDNPWSLFSWTLRQLLITTLLLDQRVTRRDFIQPQLNHKDGFRLWLTWFCWLMDIVIYIAPPGFRINTIHTRHDIPIPFRHFLIHVNPNTDSESWWIQRKLVDHLQTTFSPIKIQQVTTTADDDSLISEYSH